MANTSFICTYYVCIYIHVYYTLYMYVKICNIVCFVTASLKCNSNFTAEHTIYITFRLIQEMVRGL